MIEYLVLVAPFGGRRDADRARLLLKGSDIKNPVMGQSRGIVRSDSQPRG